MHMVYMVYMVDTDSLYKIVMRYSQWILSQLKDLLTMFTEVISIYNHHINEPLKYRLKQSKSRSICSIYLQ